MSDIDFTGRRVRIRRFHETDIDETYIGWLNDARVTQFSNQRFVAHTRASCERYFASFVDTPNLFLSVRDKEDDRAIGTMTAYFQPPHQTVDVGILLGDPRIWGGGYGQDAWCLVVDWLLGREDVRKVSAGTLACNRGMIRLMEHGCLAFEGARLRHELVDGVPHDILYFGRFAAPAG